MRSKFLNNPSIFLYYFLINFYKYFTGVLDKFQIVTKILTGAKKCFQIMLLKFNWYWIKFWHKCIINVKILVIINYYALVPTLGTVFLFFFPLSFEINIKIKSLKRNVNWRNQGYLTYKFIQNGDGRYLQNW